MALENHEVTGHETRDASPRAVLATAIVLAGVVVGVAGAVWWVQDFFIAGQPQPPIAAPEIQGAGGPVLQATPQADLASYLRAERARLAGYAWIERPNLLRIPIERAIELTVERHGNLPRRSAEATEGPSP